MALFFEQIVVCMVARAVISTYVKGPRPLFVTRAFYDVAMLA